MKNFNLTLIMTLVLSATAFAKGNPDYDLYEGIEECDSKKIEKAIKKGANIEAPNSVYNEQSDRYTPLIFAVKRECAEGVRITLDHGANPNAIRAIDMNTPLLIAARWNLVDIMKILLDPKYKTDINAKSTTMRTALIIATFHNSIDAVKMLLEHHNLDLNVETVLSPGAIGVAAKMNYLEIIDLLLDHSPEITPMRLQILDRAIEMADYNKHTGAIEKIRVYRKKHYPDAP